MPGSSKYTSPSEAFWDEVPLMLAAVDSQGAIVWCNRRAHERLNDRDQQASETPADAAAGSGWETLIPLESERIRLSSFLTAGKPGAIELQAGAEQFRIRVQPSMEHPTRVVVIEDITEQTRIVDELRERCVTLEKLLKLSRQDRQLISYEIHDGLVQEMTAAQMFLEAGLAHLRNSSAANDQAVQCFEDSAHWLRRSIEASRQLIHGLQPPELDSMGLAQAVRIMAANSPIAEKVAVESNDELVDLDESLALCIYRIVQESLTNIWKHAEASHAAVHLHRQAGQIVVEVQDDGQGFDVEEVPDQRYGLKGIRQRVMVFRGQLEVESATGQGTTIRATVPLVVAG